MDWGEKKSALFRPIEILSVEDNLADQKLIAYILKSVVQQHRLNFVSNGKEALEYLRKEGAYSNAIRPDLILLDLNIPKVDGHQVLRSIREDIRIRDIPVLVLTSSESKDDELKCLELHASRFVKPTDLDRYQLVSAAIERFCQKLSTEASREVTEDSIRETLRRERESRKVEREGLRSQIFELENQVFRTDAKIKCLEEAVVEVKQESSPTEHAPSVTTETIPIN